ncbi:AP-1 complex subunit sigma-2 [Rhizophlyctis rosea]|uniref:AP-1 complex subunit sigma-2 n=1 Tax=Rhizophlyctis rosea TaxID=64517 RepID=A0AAD5SB51_9FUNG|nr:AP-1 complex subunit sigma-2 [Rhizophlyctis rosea]
MAGRSCLLHKLLGLLQFPGRTKGTSSAMVSLNEKTKITNEAVTLILARKPSMCNILEYKEQKLIYRRYASLFFCASVDFNDNELITLEIIHRYVQLLDEYFGNVCELDIVYGMQDAYVILDEVLVGGELQESSKKAVMSHIRKVKSRTDFSLQINNKI